MPHKNCDEIIIVSKKELAKLKDNYKPRGTQFSGHSDQINNALKELNVNRDAYSDLQKFIHPTTVFLWGLRITLEEYPNSIVKFIKPF